MNNYCRNCGKKLDNNIKICPQCNTKVIDNRTNVKKNIIELEKYKRKEKLYCIVILVLYAISFLPISFIGSIFFLLATITLIYAKITLNESKIIKIFFYIVIFLTITYLIFAIVFYLSCFVALRGID